MLSGTFSHEKCYICDICDILRLCVRKGRASATDRTGEKAEGTVSERMGVTLQMQT